MIHACSIDIVHACTVAKAHDACTIAIVHAHTRAIVHACFTQAHAQIVILKSLFQKLSENSYHAFRNHHQHMQNKECTMVHVLWP